MRRRGKAWPVDQIDATESDGWFRARAIYAQRQQALATWRHQHDDVTSQSGAAG